MASTEKILLYNVIFIIIYNVICLYNQKINMCEHCDRQKKIVNHIHVKVFFHWKKFIYELLLML